MTKFISITAILAMSFLLRSALLLEHIVGKPAETSRAVALIAESYDDYEQREREIREREANARRDHEVAERAKDVAQEQRDWRMPAFEHATF